MDWMESVTSKAQIVPITSAVPTSSRNTSAFDMTQLKLEMTSNNNPCLRVYHDLFHYPIRSLFQKL